MTEFRKFYLENNSWKEDYTKEKGLCDQIISYINTNYTDANLSVGKIGQEFKLTSSYLSRRFKNFTGISIFDYLMKLRIKRAKELLVSTEESIEKVAESVGFLSSAALIRVFKKLESMTPGAFRRLYRERKTSENDNSYHLLSI